MVNQKIFRMISSVVILTQISACGFVHKIWGEKAPPRKLVTVTGENLPEITLLFSNDENIAKNVLDTYQTFILKTFDQIEGAEPNRLTMNEILSLGKVGLAKLSDKQEISLLRIKSALTLLGHKDGISRFQVEALLKWVKDNRPQAKAFYDILIKPKDHPLTSSNLIQTIQFTGSLIALGGADALTDEQLAELLHPWIPENYTHAINALPSGINLVISAFGSLCGDRIDINRWNAKKNGECLLSLVEHFKDTAPVFDFMFNGLNPITERKTLTDANSIFVEKMESWMKDHHHPEFLTQKVATFSEKLDIPAPYQFFKLTEWIPKLNSASTAKSFSPTFFIDIAHLIQNWVNAFVKVTASTQESKHCSYLEWRKCLFQGEYDTASRLFNDEYATVIRENNLEFIYKISFYDSIADYLLKAFDQDQDGVLKDDIKDLISITVRLLDSNAFAQNVINRVQEKPIGTTSTEKSISKMSREGLGEVAALAADLIPDRGGGKRTILKKLTAQVYDSEKYPSYTLDRLGITTFIYVFDLMKNLREQYLHDYDFAPVTDGPTTWIKRRRIVELLPRMLHDHFPRIYNECLDWGFERTCGVVFTEVLASAAKDQDVLEPSEIDMINLTSILLESMMNRCDRNHNDSLSTNIFDGFDEKHCVLTVSRTLATRLMRAKILQNDHTTQTLLNVIKWLPPARWIAKVGLERGTLKDIGIRAVPIISLASSPAKLGGVMSLTAEFMDPDKSTAIEKGEMGHHEDAGDELIYLHQLTDHYLPSKTWAPRTSEAARILYGPAVAPGIN